MQRFHVPARGSGMLFAVIVAAFAAGCATDGEGTAGSAPLTVAGARLPGVTTTAQEPAEFVRSSRTAAPTTFIPVGVTPPPRAEPKRNADAVKKLEEQLDAQRNRSRAYAARPKPKSQYDGKIPPRPAPAPAPAAE
ncbi:MAG: hypothetical protein CFE31_07520 [Rhizobiales bacterium PAR1]|nr:MAG: hypothetical protein CFE31_07520 [Rhizobiales bacterium PAR1]